jgi:4-amino-4-deoxy-L-arabinose transferase-like glycosyltransferase
MISRSTKLLSYLLIIVAALIPRIVDLGTFVTIDEVNGWMPRSENFLQGITTGQLADTAQSAHPGVTTMWLGAAGLLLHAALVAGALIDPTDFAVRLGLMQLMPALANSAAVVVGFWMLRRLLAPRIALLAALLWALDPFVIGFNRVLHVDGLMGSFATLSVLAACVFWLPGGRRPASGEAGSRRPDPGSRLLLPASCFLILSGICAALAVLSKSPGVVVAPTVLGIAAWSVWRCGLPWKRALGQLALWGATAFAAALIVWPALWAAPSWAIDRLVTSVTEEGGEPHQSGNFYLGRPVDVPGPQYYTTALALRLTPLSMLGIGLLAFTWRRRSPGEQAALALLAWFALLLTLELSLFPKKFDRYLEPAFPAINVLAAAGLLGLAEGWRVRWDNAWLGLIFLVAGFNAAWWHPYGIIAYNQLLGGAPAGARTFHIGWGEGMPQVAAWLNRQPNIAEQGTISSTVATLRPYLQPGVGAELPPTDGQIPSQTGFAVVYLRSAQIGLDPPLEQIAATQPAVFTVTIHGLTYAQVYELRPSPQHALRAVFGPDIELQGYDLSEQEGSLQLTLHWATMAQPPDLSLFVHLLDASGQRQVQIDLPTITAGWDAERHYRTRFVLPLPAELPTGSYQLAIGLYDPQSFTRLPLTVGSPADPVAAGDNALLLVTLQR